MNEHDKKKARQPAQKNSLENTRSRPSRRTRGVGIVGFLPHAKKTYDTMRAMQHQVTLDKMMENRIWAAVWLQYSASEKEADGDYDGAIADYTKAIQLNPFNSYAHVQRAGIYCTLDDQESAIADYSKAIELLTVEAEDEDILIPTYDNTYQVNGFAWGIDQFTAAIENDPDDAEAYKNRGDVYFLSEMYEEAIADYSKAIELNPDDEHVYRSRGTVYFLKGDEDRAAADFASAGE